MSALDRMFNDPMQQIEQLIVGTNILRKAETLSREYREAFDLLEPYGEYMTDSDGAIAHVLTIGAAADLIADHYVRRES